MFVDYASLELWKQITSKNYVLLFQMLSIEKIVKYVLKQPYAHMISYMIIIFLCEQQVSAILNSEQYSFSHGVYYLRISM